MAYEERLRRAREALAALDRRGGWIAHARATSFLTGMALLGSRFSHLLPPWSLPLGLGCFGGYIALMVTHHRILKREARERLRVLLNERGIARMTGAWREFPSRGEAYLSPSHLYASDLDLFGQGSLFQLLDETATRAGEDKLAQLLLVPGAVEEIKERQGAVKELAAALDFRQQLCLEGRGATANKADPGSFIRWSSENSPLSSVRWARALPFVIPPLTLLLWLLGKLELIPGAWAWLGLAVQLVIVHQTKGALGAVFNGISMGEGALTRLEGTFRVVEQQPFFHPRLKALSAGLTGASERASKRLHQIARWYGWAELRRTQLHAVINLLLLWDLFFLFRLDDWRKENGQSVAGWFDAMAELEALSALGGFAFERPAATYPELVAGPARFEAEGLGHPLLDQPVLNDVRLSTAGAALVLTGSNMSGKTTLLRSVGVTAVLALAGAPVLARRASLSGLRVLTSMRVKDSLERGVSYFYAEVLRLKAILDAAQASHGAVLVLLDEILMGTNTRERQYASREVIRLLRETGGLLIVATHDLTLGTLEAETQGAVKNGHFVDEVVDGKMSFDYRLREGVVTSTNAVRVLLAAGIPIQVPDAPT